MKKIALLLMVVTLVFSASSCKKDKDDPTYTKSQLIGKWKQTSPASDQGVTDYLTFTDTKLKESAAENGVESSSGEYDYTFDGKTISYTVLGEITYTITELSSTTLSFSVSWMGQSMGNMTYTKVQ